MCGGRSLFRAAFLAAFAWLAIPTIARADDGRIHVVLVDGSEVQGELVEKVPGDHLTLQLATGEIRTIPWASIQSTNPVTPTPSLPPPPSPEMMTPSTFSLGGASAYGGFGNKNDITWPKPDRTPSPFAGDHFYAGLASGLGTPVGYGGFVAAWDPVPYFELEAGVGIGGQFGSAISGMARAELPLMKWMRMGIGLGLSQNFLSSSARAPDGRYAGAPATARWLDLEFVDQSFAIGQSGFLRFSSGFAFLLNPGDFKGMCPAGSTDPISKSYDHDCVVGSFPLSPKSFGAEKRPPFVPYFGLEFLWRLS